MKDYDSIINDFLEKNISTKYPEVLFDAMAYSVKAGGKRMRPKIMLYAAEGFGGNVLEVLPFACALEYIHTYSLVHDDLPCMDDDDLRRGIPTNHKVFGEAMAVLAGDGLLNLAFEILSGECISGYSQNKLRAMYEIASASGCKGMIGGQAADILSEGKAVEAENLSFIQRHKTGAIIQAAFVCGAILSGAEAEKVDKIREAAALFGEAFQIKDDLLDVQSSTEVLGKPVGSDEKNMKVTYVSLFGVEKAQKDFNDLSKRSLSIINELGLVNSRLSDYITDLTHRNF